MTTDITNALFSVNCKSHSCPRECDGTDGYCHVCRQIRVQVRTRTLTKENEWQRDVVRFAQLLHWKVALFRPAQTTKGWRTPVGADGKGWLDLFMVRERPIAAELKNEVAECTEEQLEWIAAWEVAGVEAYVWRPQDLDEVRRVLTERRPRQIVPSSPHLADSVEHHEMPPRTYPSDLAYRTRKQRKAERKAGQ